MKTTAKIINIQILISLLLLNSCVVYHSPSTKKSKTQNQPNQILADEDFDLIFARFPLIPKFNSSKNSLFISIVNKRDRTVVSSYLEDVIGDTLFMKSSLINLKTNDQIVIHYAFSTRILQSTSIKKMEGDKYHISFKSDSNQAPIGNTLFNYHVHSIGDGLVYNYSGNLIDHEGTEVSFIAQTDPISAISLFAVAGYSSSISSKWDDFFDLCRDRNEKYEKVCKDQVPKKEAVIVHRFKRSLLEVGNFQLGQDIINDCEVQCK